MCSGLVKIARFLLFATLPLNGDSTLRNIVLVGFVILHFLVFHCFLPFFTKNSLFSVQYEILHPYEFQST